MMRRHVDSIRHGPFHERGVVAERRGRLRHGPVCYLNAVSGSCLVSAPAIDGGLSAAVHDRWRSFFLSADDIIMDVANDIKIGRGKVVTEFPMLG